MGDPYYWYWMTDSTTPAAPPALGDVLIIVLIPLLVVALCLGLAVWGGQDHRSRARTLTRSERRALAAIERGLRIDAPDLARRLSAFDAGAPTPSRPPRGTETTP